jgi:hypothetical protein
MIISNAITQGRHALQHNGRQAHGDVDFYALALWKSPWMSPATHDVSLRMRPGSRMIHGQLHNHITPYTHFVIYLHQSLWNMLVGARLVVKHFDHFRSLSYGKPPQASDHDKYELCVLQTEVVSGHRTKRSALCRSVAVLPLASSLMH